MYQVLADEKRSDKFLIENYRTKREATARERELKRAGKHENITIWNTRSNPISDLLRF